MSAWAGVWVGVGIYIAGAWIYDGLSEIAKAIALRTPRDTGETK